MIVYFADRQLHVLGQASTDLPAGLLVIDDNKIEDIETGIATFEGTIPWTDDTRAECEQYIKAGNYVLRAKDEQYEAYTITEAELNTKERTAYFYAEDASLALLNEVAITYPFDDTEVSKTLTEYLTEFLSDTGFEIGRNEAENDTEESSEPFSEQTLTERLNELAQRFKYEISYSYALSADGFQIEKMYVNVYKKRGNDTGVKLFLNKDIDSITVKYNSDNLATSLLVYGPGKEELTGYTYESDENDFEVVEQYFSQDREQTHACLQSPSALNKWGRLVDGTPRHITKVFETESTEQAQMAEEAAKELSKCIEPDVNYECEIAGHLPDGVGIGDRVYIIDERGELYLKSRLIKIETSVSNNEQKVTFGEYLLQGNTVAAKVYDVSSKLDIIEDKIANGDFDGKDGEDGAYVVSIVTQYCLADGRSIPAGGDFDDLNPTPWSTEIPTYVAGKYYWTRTVTTMSDDTVIESAPTFALGIQASAEAEIAADNASSAASTAQSIANSALGLAQATDQHFWSDSTGAHISGSNYTEAVFGSSGIELYAQNVKRLGLTTSGVKIFHSDGATVLNDISSAGMVIKNSNGYTLANIGNPIYLYGSTDTTSYTKIDSTGMTVRVSGTDYAQFGTTVTLGATTGGHFIFGSDKINCYVSSAPSTIAGSIEPTYTSGSLSGRGISLVADYGTRHSICTVMAGSNDSGTLASFGYTSSATFKEGIQVIPGYVNIIGGGTPRLTVSSKVEVGVGTNVPFQNRNAYNNTSSSSARLTITDNYTFLKYASSSRRYKCEIEDLSNDDLDPTNLYNLRIVQFKYKPGYLEEGDHLEGKTVPGLIAEEVADVYPIAVDKNKDGYIENWDERFIIPPMLALIQDQKKMIDELTERIERLEVSA